MSGTIAPANPTTPNSGGNSPQKLAEQNAMARAIILARTVNMTQQVAAGTISNPGSNANVINVSPRLVGFVKRFWVVLEATVLNASVDEDIILSPFGPANMLSQVVFTDLSNNVRIQTAGWHLNALSTVKRGYPFGAVDFNSNLAGFGNNYDVITAPTIIPKGGSNTGTVKMIYEIPLTYSDMDLRGGIWLNVTNATATLQLTVNPNPVSLLGANDVLSVYKGAGAEGGRITSLTYTIYQNYLDQIPTTPQGQPILPILDLSTVYLLNNTTQTGMVANQDYPVAYSNFRDFVSTMAIFDNGGQLTGGGDVNYWMMQAANYVNYFKVAPNIIALWTRNNIQSDTPKGMYYFSHRDKPISTLQYGNMELVLNASNVEANAKLLMGYEQFSTINVIAQAGALSIT